MTSRKVPPKMEAIQTEQTPWPTNMSLFEAAMDKAPEQADTLQELLTKVEEGMAHKAELEDRMGWWYSGFKTPYSLSQKWCTPLTNYLPNHPYQEWPTRLTTYVHAIGIADHYSILRMGKLWASAHEGYLAKAKLDTCIAQILTAQ